MQHVGNWPIKTSRTVALNKEDDNTLENGYFSIVIPAYNCAKHLKLLLPTLVDLDYPKSKYEILVVDDGSPD